MLRFALALLVGLAASAAFGDYIWWEGEGPHKSTFPRRSWFDPQDEREAGLLSGGDWLTADGKRAAGEAAYGAQYVVDVPRAGAYQFWVRKFWKHGPFRWRFDGGAWRQVGRDVALADSVVLRTHVPANWVHLGEVRLAAGRRTFEIELTAKVGESQAAGFDAFLLTRGPFMPRGKLKPDERYGRADPGFSSYEPTIDAFREDAALDLRGLNEDVAGQNGRVSRKGDDFILGDGKRVRFWAVNVSAGNAAQSRASIDYLARALAKRGVNLVRYHSAMMQRSGDWSKVDAGKLDNLHYLVHAMKREGIYTEISFFFPLWFDAKAAGFEGFKDLQNSRPFALLFYDETMQRLHRGWLGQMLAAPNPYTKLPLARDPAVGMIEIVNEDSFFFWTFNRKSVPDRAWTALEQRFAAWLKTRYRTLEAARRAWGGASWKRDGENAMEIREAWWMTGDGLKRLDEPGRRRMRDQVRFLAETQRGFFADTIRHMRGKLKYDGLVVCGNWHTADATRLDRIERWTYTAGDVIDHHAYFSGNHKGEGASYSVRVGHTFSDIDIVRHPERMPVQAMQVAGHPQIVSEMNWTNPNRYRGEATLLAAAAASRQGLDGVMWFAVGSNFLNDTTVNKFAVSSPAIAGTFPAAALMYRRGDVEEMRPLSVSRFDEQSIFSLEAEPDVARPMLDALRKADVPAAALGQVEPRTAWQLGPLMRSYGEGPVATGQPSASALKQVDWDADSGLVRIETPLSRAVIGLLGKAGRVALGDVTIDCQNEFASIAVVSLDGRPIGQSEKLLVQAFTREQLYGYRVENDRITDLGGPPFGVEHVRASINIAADAWSKARVAALDENGYALKTKVQVKRGGQGIAITLEPTVVHHVIER